MTIQSSICCKYKTIIFLKYQNFIFMYLKTTCSLTNYLRRRLYLFTYHCYYKQHYNNIVNLTSDKWCFVIKFHAYMFSYSLAWSLELRLMILKKINKKIDDFHLVKYLAFSWWSVLFSKMFSQIFISTNNFSSYFLTLNITHIYVSHSHVCELYSSHKYGNFVCIAMKILNIIDNLCKEYSEICLHTPW